MNFNRFKLLALSATMLFVLPLGYVEAQTQCSTAHGESEVANNCQSNSESYNSADKSCKSCCACGCACSSCSCYDNAIKSCN